MEIVEGNVNRSRLLAQVVARKTQFLFSQEAIDQFIVETALGNKEDKIILPIQSR
jgi:hypothetical protein